MTLSAWQATVQDANGNIVPSAEVTVLVESTGLPATIYSTRGGAALSNPFFSDVNGFAQFYANKGEYRITATNGVFSNIFRYVRIGDAGGYDVQSSPTDATAGRLLANGAHGLGVDSLPPKINDLQTTSESGFSYADAGATNAPSSGTIHATARFSGRLASEFALLDFDLLRQAMYLRTKGPGSPDSWQPVYTGANFQPDTFNGIGSSKLLYADSGTVVHGATASSSLLAYAFVGAAGAYAKSVALPAGQTWKNIGGGTASTTAPKIFARIS